MASTSDHGSRDSGPQRPVAAKGAGQQKEPAKAVHAAPPPPHTAAATSAAPAPAPTQPAARPKSHRTRNLIVGIAVLVGLVVAAVFLAPAVKTALNTVST